MSAVSSRAMSQPSVLQPLGGPLSGQRFEFHVADVVIGSAPDCEVRLEAPGVLAYHARLLIAEAGVRLIPIEGPVGINDDLVGVEAALNNGDFLWIGAPGAEDALMFQFTLGDVAAASPEPQVEAAADAFDLSELPEPAGEFQEPVAGLPDPLLQVEDPPIEFADPEPVVEAAPDFFESHSPEAFEAPALETPAHAEPDLLDIEPEPLEAAHLAASSPDEGLMEELLEPEPAPAAALPPPAPSTPVLPPPTPTSASGAFKPPAPWQSASTPAPSASDGGYASSWESPAPAPAAPEPEEVVEEVHEEAPAPPPPPPPPAAPKAAAAAPRKATTGSSPRPRVRSAAEVDAVLKQALPAHRPERTTSSMGLIVGGLIALILIGVLISWLVSSTPNEIPVSAPAAPPVTAPPVTAPAAPASAPVEATTPDAGAGVPAAPENAAPAVGPAATPPVPPPGTRPAATPAQAPGGRPAAPTPVSPAAAGARPAGPGPAAGAAPAGPAAPPSQVPRLLEEARAAMAARDLAKAGQLLDQAQRLEPGNTEVTARRAEVEGRLAILGRRFSPGATNVTGAKQTKGPSGFDLGGGGAVKTDFAAQIRCGVTPASVEPGLPYNVRCSIVNVGQKSFRLESVSVSESADGARATFSGTPPPRDIAPQGEAMIVDRNGTWSAKSQWSLEVNAKTTKAEGFVVAHSWR